MTISANCLFAFLTLILISPSSLSPHLCPMNNKVTKVAAQRGSVHWDQGVCWTRWGFGNSLGSLSKPVKYTQMQSPPPLFFGQGGIQTSSGGGALNWGGDSGQQIKMLAVFKCGQIPYLVPIVFPLSPKKVQFKKYGRFLVKKMSHHKQNYTSIQNSFLLHCGWGGYTWGGGGGYTVGQWDLC